MYHTENVWRSSGCPYFWRRVSYPNDKTISVQLGADVLACFLVQLRFLRFGQANTGVDYAICERSVNRVCQPCFNHGIATVYIWQALSLLHTVQAGSLHNVLQPNHIDVNINEAIAAATHSAIIEDIELLTSGRIAAVEVDFVVQQACLCLVIGASRSKSALCLERPRDSTPVHGSSR